jgi:hypothetical protein
LKKSEGIQMLHYTYTINIQYILLLVGDKTNIISGVLVRFENALLSAYDTMHALFASINDLAVHSH